VFVLASHDSFLAPCAINRTGAQDECHGEHDLLHQTGYCWRSPKHHEIRWKCGYFPLFCYVRTLIRRRRQQYHKLRQTFSTEFPRNGGKADVHQVALGDTRPVVTSNCVHRVAANVEKAMRALSPADALTKR